MHNFPYKLIPVLLSLACAGCDGYWSRQFTPGAAYNDKEQLSKEDQEKKEMEEIKASELKKQYDIELLTRAI